MVVELAAQRLEVLLLLVHRHCRHLLALGINKTAIAHSIVRDVRQPLACLFVCCVYTSRTCVTTTLHILPLQVVAHLLVSTVVGDRARAVYTQETRNTPGVYA